MKFTVRLGGLTRSISIFMVLICAAMTGRSATLTDAVVVDHPWARATVPGQQNAGVYLGLLAKTDLRLITVQTPVASVGEIHEMRLVDGVMQMRMLAEGLTVPADKKVELRPGGFHVMLSQLKKPLLQDTRFPLTLIFADANGNQIRQEIVVPVAAAGSVASTASHVHN